MTTPLFFTGASGGHIYPAVCLRKFFPSAKIIAIKSPVSVEILKNEKDVFFIPSLKLRKFRFSVFPDAAKLLWFVFKNPPQFILCFGSYLNLAGVFFGKIFHVPVFFFEPNLFPGKGTSYLKNFATRIFCVFKETLQNFPRKSALVKMPVRRAHLTKNEILKHLGFSEEKPVLLVFGGSQGSSFINDLVCKNLGDLSFFQIIHITGKNEFEKVKKCYARRPQKSVIFPFYEAVVDFLSSASAVISRAGAGTLAEISFYEVPAILIPFEGACLHQVANARAFESCANVIREKEFSATSLGKELEKMLFKDLWKYKVNLAKMKIADDGFMLAQKLKEFLNA